MRHYRKQEHIENFMACHYRGRTLLDQVYIDHQSLPGMALNEVNLETDFLGKKAKFPLMLNAITGGSEFSETINEILVTLASRFGLPMAVGSQTIAIEDPSTIKSFTIVRDRFPDGILLANLSGNATVDHARQAVEMIGADGIQIHLNVAQELSMAEGDRDFRHIAENIKKIAEEIKVPLIVKEVGFGISAKAVKQIYDLGVRNIDISGYGGSNFIEIENMRNPRLDLTEVYRWGIPTALSLLEAQALNLEGLSLIASGGIRSSLDALHSLVIGADMVAISGEVLRFIIHGGFDHGNSYLYNFTEQLKRLMLMVGCRNLEELHQTPFRIHGVLKELYEASWFRKK